MGWYNKPSLLSSVTQTVVQSAAQLISGFLSCALHLYAVAFGPIRKREVVFKRKTDRGASSG